MSTATIAALMPVIVPFVFAAIGYSYHLIAVRAPAQQRQHIEQFAATAVKRVEQEFSYMSNEEKKTLAMDTVKGFFAAFKLPTPNDYVLSAFIEAACHSLPSCEEKQ